MAINTFEDFFGDADEDLVGGYNVESISYAANYTPDEIAALAASMVGDDDDADEGYASYCDFVHGRKVLELYDFVIV